ncbi:hypothetical protein MFIFM68171_08160 [Madurella fahalii]|uniref:Peptidase S8/S53 domain-containing protein n=1 Tax=Madurella fahalii TaxID=1157608 RepID=A0ABQ0GJR0_9PEZI
MSRRLPVFQDGSDQESSNQKKRRQGSSTNLADRPRRGGAEPTQHHRPALFKRGETCEDLRQLVNEDPSDDGYRRFLKDPKRQAQSQYFKRLKARATTSTAKAESNIFHELVLQSKDKEWPREDIAKVLARILQKPKDDPISAATATNQKRSAKKDAFAGEELLEEDFNDGTPILMALKSGRHRNLPFVEELLRLDPPPSNLGKIFWMESEKSTWRYCLHAAIDNADVHDDDFHIHEMVQHMRQYQPPAPRRTGDKPQRSPFEEREKSEGNTPLHLAVKKAPVDTTALADSGSVSAEAGSVASRMQRAKKLIEVLVEACPVALGVRNGIGENSEEKGRTPYQERIFQLAFEFHKWKTRQSANTAAIPPPANANDTAEPYRAMMEAAEDGAGYVSDAEKECEPDLDKDATESSFSRMYYGDDNFRKFVISDPIASYISHYCVASRDMTREKAMDYLYRRGEERAIEFNLLGFPRQKITQDYLESLETHVRFERTLKYVALPRLAVETTGGSSQTGSALTQKTPAADLTTIFEWLHTRYVRKIQKVTVFDSELPSHTDDKIVEALKRFDVEEWDWDKMDLSSEVVFAASSNSVREISLQASGNEAVLQGWCAPGGFGNKEKFPKGQEDKQTLQRRGNMVKESLESRESGIMLHKARLSEKARAVALEAVDLIEQVTQPTTALDIEGMQGKIRDLRNQIDNLKPAPLSEDKLHVDFSIVPVGMRANVSRSTRIATSSDGERISRIKELTSFFRNVKRNEQESLSKPQHRVKIAIIDDGLDSSLYIIDRTHCRVVAGQSFCTSYTGYTNNYYVPSGNHGTQVASIICQICPEVDLYIARLDEQYTRSGNRVINPASAEKAIMWATGCGVDIICMSWTIEDPNGDRQFPNLSKAIDKAYKNRIIMFCSASDQGGSSMVRCYPGAFKGNKSIRIGSCSASNVPSVWVNPKQVDFLLPGENIVIRNSDGTSECQTGSSFATAVAAGLGGLMLYCSLQLGTGILPSVKNARLGHSEVANDEENETSSSEESGSESDAESYDQPRRGNGAARGQNGSAKGEKDEEILWDRSRMYNVFDQMSIPPGKDKTLLVMPETFLIDRLKGLLKRKGKGLDKLDWDAKFEAALRKVMQQLTETPTRAAYDENFQD